MGSEVEVMLEGMASTIRDINDEIAEAERVKRDKERKLFMLKKGMERLVQNLNEQLNGKVEEFERENKTVFSVPAQ